LQPSIAARMYEQSVELRFSACVWIVSLHASLRVPLIDTLDNKNLLMEEN